jgi:hypothetical protein
MSPVKSYLFGLVFLGAKKETKRGSNQAWEVVLVTRVYYEVLWFL